MTTKTIQISENLLFQEVRGETVLLDLATEQYFGLNAVGTRIWQMINEHRACEEILQVLQDEFDAPREQLESDLAALLSQLSDAGLITISWS